MVKVTLPIQDQKTLTAAQGYLELAMPREALAELASLSEEGALSHPGLEMRIVILLKLHRWKTAAACARKLCRLLPEQPAGFIHLAFCLHELGETAQARDILRKAPATVRKDATCCYNLACYEAVLGELDAARLHLAQSISIDKRFRDFARTDSDLAPLHKELQ
jgi:predicted Zn-dependent protease